MLLGCLSIVVSLADAELSLAARAVMTFGFCSTLGVAGLVAARSSREAAAVDREERERPVLDELAALDDAFGGAYDSGPLAYFGTMERWARAMLELTDHATATPGAMEAGVADELRAASEDTRELRALLQDSVLVPPRATAIATVYTVCQLWEASQIPIEQLAARVDPEWHRRWRARSVVERLVRRGGPQPDAMVLPYQGSDRPPTRARS
jgi:hypothetical protein